MRPGGSAPAPSAGLSPTERHLVALAEGFAEVRRGLVLLESWGDRLAADLPGGARLLAAGNGGSAAEAQHLTSELVGRYRRDRLPLSALSLHAETSSVTAIVNDYGPEEVFARQVLAHGRPGDYLVAFSTSGRSANVRRAVDAARRHDVTTWALTGPAPNPLADASDEAFCVGSDDPAVVQELHLVAVHLICEALDAVLCCGSQEDSASPAARSGRRGAVAGAR